MYTLVSTVLAIIAFTALLTAEAGHTIFLPYVSDTVLPDPATCQSDPPADSDNIADARTICIDQTVTGTVSTSGTNQMDRDDTYRVFLYAGTTAQINMTGAGGDADLYLYPPGSTDIFQDSWTVRSTRAGSDEIIRILIPTSGFWYINVYAYSGTITYEFIVTQPEIPHETGRDM